MNQSNVEIRRSPCTACGGAGYRDRDGEVICVRCRGTGMFTETIPVSRRWALETPEMVLDTARAVIAEIQRIARAAQWRRWRWRNAKELDALLSLLPEGELKDNLLAAALEKNAEFEIDPNSPEAA